MTERQKKRRPPMEIVWQERASNEIRCSACRRLLARIMAPYPPLQLVCPRCGKKKVYPGKG